MPELAAPWDALLGKAWPAAGARPAQASQSAELREHRAFIRLLDGAGQRCLMPCGGAPVAGAPAEKTRLRSSASSPPRRAQRALAGRHHRRLHERGHYVPLRDQGHVLQPHRRLARRLADEVAQRGQRPQVTCRPPRGCRLLLAAHGCGSQLRRRSRVRTLGRYSMGRHGWGPSGHGKPPIRAPAQRPRPLPPGHLPLAAPGHRLLDRTHPPAAASRAHPRKADPGGVRGHQPSRTCGLNRHTRPPTPRLDKRRELAVPTRCRPTRRRSLCDGSGRLLGRSTGRPVAQERTVADGAPLGLLSGGWRVAGKHSGCSPPGDDPGQRSGSPARPLLGRREFGRDRSRIPRPSRQRPRGGT